MADQSRLDKIEEILKPHYSEIRDPDVRLSALCACNSDAERAALAEGLCGRASVWATEALLAVLTNPDLPPVEPALFHGIVSKLIVRLAEDAAEFFSLDQYLNFPKYRADIGARLMEDLPKIAKDPSEVNRRRYLGEPKQGTMPDLSQWRRQQEALAIQKARDILNSRPGWKQSQLALIQAEEDFEKTLHLDPWQRALNYYRATGEAWLEIVSDNETLQAFYTILPVIMEGMYWKCLGSRQTPSERHHHQRVNLSRTFAMATRPFERGRQSVHRAGQNQPRSEEHTSELQSPCNLVCRLLLEKKKTKIQNRHAQPDSATPATPDKSA